MPLVLPIFNCVLPVSVWCIGLGQVVVSFVSQGITGPARQSSQCIPPVTVSVVVGPEVDRLCKCPLT